MLRRLIKVAGYRGFSSSLANDRVIDRCQIATGQEHWALGCAGCVVAVTKAGWPRRPPPSLLRQSSCSKFATV